MVNLATLSAMPVKSRHIAPKRRGQPPVKKIMNRTKYMRWFVDQAESKKSFYPIRTGELSNRQVFSLGRFNVSALEGRMKLV